MNRRGVSLLEVLIAVFVLTFGLMSVAMVIPAGRKLMVDAAQSDRATACGRATIDDVQIRGWDNPRLWWSKWGASGVDPTRATALADGNLLYGESYFLDPRFFVLDENEQRDSVRYFPYAAYPNREFSLWGSNPRQWPDRALPRRVAFYFGGFYSSGALVDPGFAHDMHEALADRLTTWADDLVFSENEPDNGRPRQMMLWSNNDPAAVPVSASSIQAYPVLPRDGFSPGPDTPTAPVFAGNFTWAVQFTPIIPLTYKGTFDHDSNPATPEVAEVDGGLITGWDHDSNPSTLPIPTIAPSSIRRWKVDVVVFYKRDRYCPEGSSDTNVDELQSLADAELCHERSVYARLIGGGISGGDVELFVPNGDPARPVGYLNVKKNDWIMLKGLDRSRFVGHHGATSPDFPNGWYRPTRPTTSEWYRVVSVDDVVPEPSFPNPADPSNPLSGRKRLVTLAGPDWNVDTCLPNGFDVNDIAEAALIDDVAGAYTTIIEAQR